MTTAQFVSDADTIDHVPAVDVAAGEVIFHGDLLAVAKHDIEAGDQGVLGIAGVYKLAKDPTVAFAAGDRCYWDQAGRRVGANSAHPPAGTIVADVSLSTDSALVIINSIQPGGSGELSLDVYSQLMGRFLSIDATEASTGMRWTDGRPIYAKYVDMGVLVDAGTKQLPHSITSLGTVVECWGVVAEDDFELDDDYEAGQSMHALSATGGTTVYVDDTYAKVRTGWDASGHYCRVYLLYTRSTDAPVAANPGCISHSVDEQPTGWNWIDGRQIYVKTIDTGAFPNAATKQVAHGIGTLGEVVFFSCVGTHTGGTQMPLPRTYSNESTDIWITADNINLQTTTDRSDYTTSFATLYYTKTSDKAGMGQTRGPSFSVLEERYAGFTQGGKRVYFKVIDCGGLPNATSKQIEHGIQNLAKVVHIDGMAFDSGLAMGWYDFPLIIRNDLTELGAICRFSRSRVYIETGSDLTRFSQVYLIAFYTKEFEYLHEGHGAYSTTETPTGERWIDGSMVYRKTIDTGALPNSVSKFVDHGIAGLDPDKVIKIEAYTSNGSTALALPRISFVLSECVLIGITNTQVVITTDTDLTAYDQSYVTIYYTK